MSNPPLMPMATAVWLVENTTLTFKQIANFCNLHELEIDPKSHSAWTGGKQKLMDKGRISKFNKKFQNFKSDKKN